MIPRSLLRVVVHQERNILEKVVREPSSQQGMVMRAKIVLQAGAGQSNNAIAKTLKVTRNTVLLWRERWKKSEEKRQRLVEENVDEKSLREAVEESLKDAYRSGAPSKFSAEELVQIIALACEVPKNSGYPISHWTAKELAVEAVKRGIVESISERQVGRFLK